MSQPSNPGRRGSLGVLFLTVFLDLLGFGIVIPILPLYAETLHASRPQLSILMAVYSLMQLVFAPLLGRLSDRGGRRPVLLLSIFGSAASQLGYALAPSFWWLVVARGLAGVCGANIAAAQAYVSDVTTESDRAAGMGAIGAAMGLGFVFGPALGGLLSHSAALPFFVAAGLSAVNFLLALVILKEPRAAGERSTARALSWAGLARVVSTARLRTLMLLYFVITFGFANLEATLSLYLEQRFHGGGREAGMLLGYAGVLVVLVQGGLVRVLVPMVGERAMILGGTLLMGAGFLLQAVSMTVPLLLVAVGIISIGSGCNSPSLSSLISRAATGEHQGGVLGVSQSLGALARVVGPIVGIDMLGISTGAPYVTGGVAMLVAFAFAAIFVTQPKAPAEPAAELG